jgi:hypothetical protein
MAPELKSVLEPPKQMALRSPRLYLQFFAPFARTLPNKMFRRTLVSYISLALVVVWQHRPETRSGPVSAVPGR